MSIIVSTLIESMTLISMIIVIRLLSQHYAVRFASIGNSQCSIFCIFNECPLIDIFAQNESTDANVADDSS